MQKSSTIDVLVLNMPFSIRSFQHLANKSREWETKKGYYDVLAWRLSWNIYIYIYIYLKKAVVEKTSRYYYYYLVNTITINNNLLSYSRMDKNEVNNTYSAARNQFLRFLSSPTNLKRYLFDKLILWTHFMWILNFSQCFFRILL